MKFSHLSSNFALTLLAWVISEPSFEQPGPGIVIKQTVDKVLDVIINFI